MNMPISSFKIWLLAIRPRTLPASIAPVLIGTAMAFGDGMEHWPSAIACLLGALAIQIGTNLANDYFDFKKGADTQERIGPLRVTQAGLIKPLAMICAMILFFSLAAIVCVWLVLRGGWPIALIGVLAILCGIFYTAGPLALGYLGLGEVFVLVFFGPVAVAGTYYVQSLEIYPAVVLAGLAPGLFSVAILAVNNLRDIETDRASGKKTLAVRLGKAFAQNEYLIFVLGAGLIPILVYGVVQDHIKILAAAGSVLFAIPGIRMVCTKSDGPSLNETLGYTGKLLLLYSILFSIGWVL